MCPLYVIIQIVIQPNISFYFPSGNNGRISLPLSSTTATEKIDAPQTGSIISNGDEAPHAARTAAMVEGINWMDAVFKVINVKTVFGEPQRASSV